MVSLKKIIDYFELKTQVNLADGDINVTVIWPWDKKVVILILILTKSFLVIFFEWSIGKWWWFLGPVKIGREDELLPFIFFIYDQAAAVSALSLLFWGGMCIGWLKWAWAWRMSCQKESWLSMWRAWVIRFLLG